MADSLATITVLPLIDPRAAYDTVNHRVLLKNLIETIGLLAFFYRIGDFLWHQMVIVDGSFRRKDWHKEMYHLWCCITYMNVQPVPDNLQLFIYADGTVVATQSSSSDEVARRPTVSLEKLGWYYTINHLRPNANQSQVYAFHLWNQNAGVESNVTWQENWIQYCPTPKYLSVTLDGMLSFKQHCLNIKAKV